MILVDTNVIMYAAVADHRHKEPRLALRERVARGESLGSILRDPSLGIDNEVYQRMEGDLRWHFMRTG